MRVLIAGCGYVGSALGADLVRQGHQVVGLRRTPSEAVAASLRDAGVEPWFADLTQADAALPAGKFDWVVYCAAAGRGGGPAEYRLTYVEAQRQLLARLASEPPTKYVYTSSTSVYAQQQGEVVKENSPTEPEGESGRILLEAERLLLEAAAGGFPAVILRVAGIYGPERGHLFKQFLANEARIHGDGHRCLNMVHREDVVGAIAAALKSGRRGEIYNVVDQEPVTEIHFYTWLAETLGKFVPPKAAEGSPEARSRPSTSKKVSSRRLTMELGYRLKYPTFRQGYTAEIKALTDAGQLNIELEPR